MDPHQIKIRNRIRIRIRIKVIRWIRSRIQIRINLQMTSQNIWNMSLFSTFEPLFGKTLDPDPDPYQGEVGSGSASNKNPNPDASNKNQNPYPHQGDKSNPDPHRTMWIHNNGLRGGRERDLTRKFLPLYPSHWLCVCATLNTQHSSSQP
jgi:hypothetical protein